MVPNLRFGDTGVYLKHATRYACSLSGVEKDFDLTSEPDHIVRFFRHCDKVKIADSPRKQRGFREFHRLGTAVATRKSDNPTFSNLISPNFSRKK